jgi:Ca2+-binding RTX toxin-like protein
LSDITFGTRGINALGFDAPSAATIVWDDLVATFNWEQRIDEGTFGIDIPGVNAGATPYLSGKLGIEITLTYDAGAFGVDYILRDTATGFSEWQDERATAYVPPGGGTPLAQYQNAGPVLMPDLDFVSGALPFTAPTGGNRFTADFVYGLQAGVKDIDLSIGGWGVDYDILEDDVISLVDIPDGRENIFDIQSGQPIDIDLGTFPIQIEKLIVPETVSDYGGVTYGAGEFPSLTRSGVGDPFFHASFSMAAFLANLFPAFKILKGEFELAGPKTVLYWTVLDVQANAMVSLVQEVMYTPQGVRLEVDTSYPDASFTAQHFEGALGDSFAIDTPQGQGRVNADVTYTPFGEWRSKIGVQVSANIEVSALEIGIRNTRIKDFDEKVGPLVHFFVPDEQGWQAEPLWLMENRLSVKLDGPDTADGVIGATRRYTAWYQNDVIGTNGADTLQATDEQIFIDGLAGNDLLAGSWKTNNVFGNTGADTVHGHGGADVVTGGFGNDIGYGDAGPGLPAGFTTGFNQINYVEGDDIVLGGRGNDTLYGQGGNDLLYGGDLSSGGTGRDLLFGGDGADTIYGSQADGSADTLDGGAGNDAVVISRSGQLQGMSISPGTTVNLPDGTRLTGFEQFRFVGGFGNDTLTGGSRADSLVGGAGDDVISGGFGANTLDGGAGDDFVVALHDGPADVLRGGAGWDRLDYDALGSGPILLVMGAEMTLPGGTTASGFEEFAIDAGFGSALADIVAGGAGDDVIVTRGGNDALGGGAGRNVLDAGDGNDVIASFGIDTIYGGNGLDTLLLDAPTVGRGLGAGGWVLAWLSGTQQTLSNGGRVQGVERLDWTGSGRGDDVVGGAYNDSLFGAGGNDSLDGGGAKDAMDGGSGDDVIRSREGQAADTLVGGEGDDRLILSLANATSQIILTNWYGTGVTTFLTGPQGTTSFSGFERLTFWAGSANDVIRGGDAPTPAVVVRGAANAFGDRLYGGHGNDQIDGRGGRDLLVGGYGADTLIWSPGDRIDGGWGDDLVWVDAARGVPARFVMAPLDADDGIDPLIENETFLSDGTRIANVERLRYVGGGAAGAVTVGGGIFNDTVGGSGFADSIAGARGADSLLGGAGADSIRGDEGADTLLGEAGADRLEGGLGNDRLIGGAPGGFGADTLDGGDGADTIVADGRAVSDGGLGADLLWLDRSSSVLAWTVDIRPGGARRNLADGGGYLGFEELRFFGGSGGDVAAVGSGLAHRLLGGAGNDTVTADLTGEAASQLVTIDAANTLRFGLATAGGFERAVLKFGAGNDLLSTPGTTVMGFDAQGGSGADSLLGGTFGDSLQGGQGNDSLFGHAGADTLQGGAGQDTIQGGDGRDLVEATGFETGDLFDGGVGNDTVSFAGETSTVVANLALATATRGGVTVTINLFEGMTGGAGSDSLTGTVLSDTLLGGGGDDRLAAQAGQDQLDGGDGSDSLDGGFGADTMAGGAGNDTIRVDDAGDLVVELSRGGTDLVYSTVSYSLGANLEQLALEGSAFFAMGNGGANTLTGNAGANSINGLAGNDSLAGFGSNDTLYGGGGNDTMAGGGGTDVFVLDGGRDSIADFTAGEDIWISRALVDPTGGLGVASGPLDPARFGHDGSPAGWCVAVVTTRTEKLLVFDPDGDAATGYVTLASFAVGGALPAAADIFFVA